MKERKQTFIVDKDISLLEAIFVFKKDLSTDVWKNTYQRAIYEANR